MATRPTRVRDGVLVHPSALPTPEPGSITEVVVSQALTRHARNTAAMQRVARAPHPSTRRMLDWIAGMGSAS